MSRPNAVVLSAPGTNREREVALALDLAGAEPALVPIGAVAGNPGLLDRAQLVVLAGGFSYADALGSGRRWAFELRRVLGDRLAELPRRGVPVLGICNGFQVLVRLGMLPGALGHNAGGTFVCRWVRLHAASDRCVWTRDLDEPVDCPVAHGEGRYVIDPASPPNVALTYADNPNGSDGDIAGVHDETGLVLGLMPHPEDHVTARMHPRRRRGAAERAGLGLRLFEQGVRHAKEA